MGLFSWFKRNKKTEKTTLKVDTPKTETKTTGGTNGASTKTKAPKATTKKATPAKDLNPQCAAITASGGQCKNSARGRSKYCGRHKGYQPPGAAKANKAPDTKPAVSKAKDTKPSARRTQVSEGDYKLFKKGNRYFFSKKSQADAKKDGASPVYTIPKDRTVVKTQNGLPVLKKK